MGLFIAHTMDTRIELTIVATNFLSQTRIVIKILFDHRVLFNKQDLFSLAFMT
jgi:hypothetical protein